MPLPPLPRVELDEVEDLLPEQPRGFLRLHRKRLTVRYGGGQRSEPFTYDWVHREALDAVVVAAHFMRDGQRHVYLRSALRPPALLRPERCRPLKEKDTLGQLWELPAGLVESDECSEAGLRGCSARELHEELGFDMPADAFVKLGQATFPSCGVIGERHHLFHIEVIPARRGTPTEDGSVLEQNAIVTTATLTDALEACRRGTIEDAKTELALRRLAEL